MTAVGGTTLSSLIAGSVIVKTGLVATAVTAIDNATGAITEPATTQTSIFTPVVVVKKTAATTQIEYRYITNNTSLGKMRFFASYLPLSPDGVLSPA